MKYICSGNFTQNGDIYTANLADSNFPAILSGTCNDGTNVILIGGIIIQLTIESNDKITINELLFNQNFNPIPTNPPTTSPATNVTFNVQINNIEFNYSANFNSLDVNDEFSPYTVQYFYSISQQQQDFVFSKAALKQVATTNTQTAALLTKLDPINIFLSSDQKNQIANESGKIAAYSVSM
jgi:hypothetical protein